MKTIKIITFLFLLISSTSTFSQEVYNLIGETLEDQLEAGLYVIQIEANCFLLRKEGVSNGISTYVYVNEDLVIYAVFYLIELSRYKEIIELLEQGVMVKHNKFYVDYENRLSYEVALKDFENFSVTTRTF